MRQLKLLWRDNDCQLQACPSLYETETEYVVQGKILDQETRVSMGMPSDEDAIVVPKALLDRLRQSI